MQTLSSIRSRQRNRAALIILQGVTASMIGLGSLQAGERQSSADALPTCSDGQARVLGTVCNREGHPFANLAVSVKALDGRQASDPTDTDSSGSFTFCLRPGRYVIEVEAPINKAVDHTVSQGRNRLSIAPPPSGACPASVLHAEADPPRIKRGRSSTLGWESLNVKEVRIDSTDPRLRGDRAYEATGEETVSPRATTAYTVKFLGDNGQEVAREVRIEVHRSKCGGWCRAFLALGGVSLGWYIAEDRAFDSALERYQRAVTAADIESALDGLDSARQRRRVAGMASATAFGMGSLTVAKNVWLARRMELAAAPLPGGWRLWMAAQHGGVGVGVGRRF